MRKCLAAITLVAIAASIVPNAAQEANTTFGVLDCVVAAGTRYIIGSKKALGCTFTSANPKVAPETYIGVIRKLGLDVGPTPRAVLRWRVLAPTGNVYAPGVLAGNYNGVGAEATVVVGAGANLLVGGSNRTYTLQPLSVQVQTGLNVAAGVTSFQLRAAK
ncbi:DUF992 domain-containing protein [Mesorhizobium sp.]|uniref:DUF992 domain-containing protein n=1 Tax=Mesorhizobium sp. TaxID=1871066 RepID=UPI000FEAAAA1|nr:DUF992 domain-containing protein [Mesorhizobium sp.]RWO48659.1 MAG: DUF992 domain-containing protein [Mesorhizobium sp.]TIN22325.1 MAG: DUF992 domain-containing protein [Mesorhizobium sp.]TIN40109.1 MAG: DUF992 domain-containing protein [Mesorhizobium sp.]TJU83781.1 MAG: DUF992 domain-containing protein [Mesorhizobium sp.]